MRPIAIAHDPRLPGWWAKLRLFDPSLGVRGRILYLDLDTLVVGSLAALAETPTPFVTIEDRDSQFHPPQRQVIKRFNSSVMAFDAGVYADLWTAWSPGVAERLWGDQDWLAERHPESQVWPAAWFPRISSLTSAGALPPAATVILVKKPKNEVVADQWPWFNAIWRAA